MHGVSIGALGEGPHDTGPMHRNALCKLRMFARTIVLLTTLALFRDLKKKEGLAIQNNVIGQIKLKRSAWSY